MINYKNISIFLALFAINNIIYLTPSFGNPYYLVMLVGLLLLLKKGAFTLDCLGMFLMIVASALSIVFNDIPNGYHPWLRLATFCVVGSVVTPIFKGKFLDKSKVLIFWTLRIASVLVVVLSFLSKFVGLGRSQGVGYFMGITVHSITLGLLASNAMIFLLFLFFLNNNYISKIRGYLIFLMLLCFVCLLLSASRAAVVACFGGGLVFVYSAFQINEVKWMRYLFALSIVFLLTFQFWKSSALVLIKKNSGQVVTLDMSSRTSHWQKLFDTFVEHPFFGVGFSYLGQEDDIYGNGKVEPGNSWLCILTMTGIWGGIVLGTIIIGTVNHLRHQSLTNRYQTSFLYGLLFCEVLHMCSEGYILAAGDYGFFNFWSLIGVIWAYSRNPKIEFAPNSFLGRYCQKLIS